MSRESLAQAQAALVAALVAGGPTPAGFDERLVGAAAAALAAKRAGEAAAVWPLLCADFGSSWVTEFARWCHGRPPQGGLRDGWELARAHADRLGPAARLELAEREVRWRYDGGGPPVRRRTPAVRRVGRTVVVQVAGRVATLPG